MEVRARLSSQSKPRPARSGRLHSGGGGGGAAVSSSALARPWAVRRARSADVAAAAAASRREDAKPIGYIGVSMYGGGRGPVARSEKRPTVQGYAGAVPPPGRKRLERHMRTEARSFPVKGAASKATRWMPAPVAKRRHCWAWSKPAQVRRMAVHVAGVCTVIGVTGVRVKRRR